MDERVSGTAIGSPHWMAGCLTVIGEMEQDPNALDKAAEKGGATNFSLNPISTKVLFIPVCPIS